MVAYCVATALQLLVKVFLILFLILMVRWPTMVEINLFLFNFELGREERKKTFFLSKKYEINFQVKFLYFVICG